MLTCSFKTLILVFFALQLSACAGFILDPMKVESFHIEEPFDFTKKGNVYEKTFRMPIDLWRFYHYILVRLVFEPENDYIWGQLMLEDPKYHDDIKKIFYMENAPIKDGSDFIERLRFVWLPYNSGHGCGPRCHLKPEQKDKIMRLLKSYHPNQHFKFKLTLIPLANAKAKQEKTVEFPLYFIAKKKEPYPTHYMDHKSIALALFDARVLRKYHIKIEVLENTSLPKGIRPVIILEGPWRK